MYHNYVMSMTKHRTSFALDEATADLLRRLARRWDVSQAEVIRRAVKLAADRSDAVGDDIRERLRSYRASGRIDRKQADEYLRTIDEDRSRWRRDR